MVWFADEEKVRNAFVLLEKPVAFPDAREVNHILDIFLCLGVKFSHVDH